MDIELTLNDYWRILRKRKWLMTTVFLTTALSTAVYTNRQISMYRAQAMVKFEPPGTKLLGADLPNWDLWTVIQTQVRILRSRDMAAAVAKRLERPVEEIQGAITADRVEQSNLLMLSAVGPDAEATARIANAVADVFLQRDLGERTGQARQALEDAIERRQDVEKSLRALEEDRKRYQQSHPSAGTGAALAGQLAELEARRKELLKRFTAAHPEMIKLEQQLNTVRARLSESPTQETALERIVRDIRVNEEVYVTLSRQIEEQKIQVASMSPFVTIISRAVTPDAPYAPNRPLNYMMGMVLGAFLAILLAFLVENMDISISTIEDIEKILGVPVLGIIPHFGAERRWLDLRNRLMRVERYPMEVFRSMLVFHHRVKSPVIEVYHSLRANVGSQLQKPEGMVLTFTSTGVAEGKTLTAVNFALAAAQGGLKTLLVGADIRRPVLYRIFGLPKQPGLIEVLLGKMRWQDVVFGTVDFLMGEMDLERLVSFPGIDNFHIMTGWSTSGSDVVNTFQSPRLPELISELRGHFDVIIFDCPPVLLFVDSLLVAPNTDGVVLIYQAGKMARRALKRAKDQIVTSKATILGVVLNDMRASDLEPRYGYYYDYGHYLQKDKESAE